MTTHQLATLLEHLKLGFGDGMKSDTGKSFAEAITTFRELPDQPLKDVVKLLRKTNSPDAPVKSKTAKSPVDISAIIERIRLLKSGSENEETAIDLSNLNNANLKEILKSFGQQPTTTIAGNTERVKQLYQSTTKNGASSAHNHATREEAEAPHVFDPAEVEDGVRIYCELRDNRTLTIQDARTGFDRLRHYSKPVIEEISRRLKYTPSGSKTEILDRLLSNLEGLKMNQYRMDQILTGT